VTYSCRWRSYMSANVGRSPLLAQMKSHRYMQKAHLVYTHSPRLAATPEVADRTQRAARASSAPGPRLRRPRPRPPVWRSPSSAARRPPQPAARSIAGGCRNPPIPIPQSPTSSWFVQSLAPPTKGRLLPSQFLVRGSSAQQFSIIRIRQEGNSR
jgi:hypothetical protein